MLVGRRRQQFGVVAAVLRGSSSSSPSSTSASSASPVVPGAAPSDQLRHCRRRFLQLQRSLPQQQQHYRVSHRRLTPSLGNSSSSSNSSHRRLRQFGFVAPSWTETSADKQPLPTSADPVQEVPEFELPESLFPSPQLQQQTPTLDDMALPQGITFYRSLVIAPLPRDRGCNRFECRIRTDLDVCQLIQQDGPTFLRMVRDIDAFMLENRRDPNYHLEFLSDPREPGFRAHVAYDNPNLRPPKPRKACISCDSDNPVSALSFYGRSELCNVWLDGKARAHTPFIVTPFRHLDSLVEMTDAELLDMYRQAALTILKQQQQPPPAAPANAEQELAAAVEGLKLGEAPAQQDPPPPPLPVFHGPHILILNQGNFRNLTHIHLKVRLSVRTFQEIRDSRWNAELFMRWSRLQELSADRNVMSDFVGGGAVIRQQLPIPERVQAEIRLLQQQQLGQQQQQQQQQHEQQQKLQQLHQKQRRQ